MFPPGGDIVNKNLCHWIAATLLFAALALPSSLSAQQPRYRLIDLGTLGGPQSYLNDGMSATTSVSVLNSRGDLAGWADTSVPDPFPAFCFNEDCHVSHAFEWHAGVRTDLGALAGGLSSQASWASASGLIVGLAENGEIDPLIPGLPEIRAVLWRNHEISDLGTLPEEGGYESQANAVNSRGQVVGWATNTAPDPNSMAAPGFLPTQTRAFLWQNGTMKDLGTLATGSDAIAQFINERGQVAGWSYIGEAASCVLPGPTPIPEATHSFIWDENHGMKDLGTLGGGGCVIATALNESGMVVGNYLDDLLERGFLWNGDAIQDLGGSLGGQQAGAEDINNSGHVAGFGTLAGEATFHATLWKTIGEITDLGVIGRDLCSFATSINSKTQVVGASAADCFASDPDHQARAILWEDGSLFDLNTLIAPGASLYLQFASHINERGEIAGTGLDSGGQNQHAFLLVPCAANEGANCEEVILGASDVSPASLAPLARRSPVSHASSSILQTFRSQLGNVPPMLTPTGAASTMGNTTTANAITSLTITSGAPLSGTVGKLYDVRCSSIFHCLPIVAGFPVTAAGGLPPYSWTWTPQAGSSLPPGLLFPDPGGLYCLDVSRPAICGKPTTAGSYEVVITVKDSESPPRYAHMSYTIPVFP